jgi:signal transduction histidine kinase/DNA-binding response OmpR family regulator
MSNYGFTTQNRYAYKLEGIDKDWTYLGTEHLIRLPNLPSGKYDLVIAGIDQNGNWSSNSIRIPIYAKEYFYKQAWFYIVCALPFIIFAIIWIRRLRKEKGRLEKEVEKRTIEIRKDKEFIEQQASELQQLDQMKSRFFANISHDLRTPITLISGPAELLAEEEYVKKKSSFHQAILSIGQNSKRLLRLIDEILDLARLESKTIKLHEESIPLNKFTRSIFDSYTVEAKRKKLDFQFKSDISDDIEILVDPNRLEKILNNLLSNALKFTSFNDSIILRVSLQENSVVLEVADSGRGIPEEDIPHVFERYFQSKNEKLVQTSGSGIGLSLCQEFAKLMEGELTVKSIFGKGSTFQLKIPAKQSLEKSNWQEENLQITNEELPNLSTQSNGPSKNASTIMIVEDNPEVQSFVKSLLENDYKVICFDDGQAALDFLESQSGNNLPIDLILSDINMPRLDGYGLIEAIKQNEKWHQLPMIMLTARQQEKSKLKALRMGVDDYLTKPFSPIELKIRIQNILNNYQNRVATKEEFIAVNPEFEDTISADQVWLKELEEHSLVALDQKIELTINYLADKMALGPRQTARKVKLLTGLTIGKYIHEVKLQKARHLLEQKAYPTVAEVGYACGFNSPSYFTKIFNRHFGKTPTSYY